jgi:hypothetical protein
MADGDAAGGKDLVDAGKL